MTKSPKKPAPKKSVDALKHTGEAKRRHIPTAETQSFVAEAEQRPTPVLYPRNQDLDPQLVWRGKDAEDAAGALTVDSVPIYIQEKVHPHAIVEDLKRRSDAVKEERRARGEAKDEEEAQFGFDAFWSDFNGLDDPDAEFEFYDHERNWTNRMILGDSLMVMTSLAEKEALKGQVQCIYFDPPYGIKFNSNWQVSTKSTSVGDKKVDIAREPEVVKAFRDTWSDGINTYLSYLRDRLTVARDLLTDSGSIFVQIGDENVHLVRAVLDESFGADNFVAQVIFMKTTGKASGSIDNTYDVILWYGKNRDGLKYNKLYFRRNFVEDQNFRYLFDRFGSFYPLPERLKLDPRTAWEEGWLARLNPLTSQSASSTTLFTYEYCDQKFKPSKGGWKTNIQGMRRIHSASRLAFSGKTLGFIRCFEDFPYQGYGDIWSDTRQSGFGDGKLYVVQTGTRIIERCLLMATDPGDLVLDPTCGSGTTAYVAEQWGRRWITVDTSRVALALARQRLMAGRFPYYLLQDSKEGAEKEAELTGKPPADGPFARKVRQGFVYERVPHITLKSIANNAEIDEIWERWQETLEPLREALNQELEQAWEEWEIPRHPVWPWSDKAAKAHGTALAAKTELAAEMEAAQGMGGGFAGDLGAVRRKYAEKAGTALSTIEAETGERFTLETLPDVPGDPWPEEAADLHRQWWEARRARQAEIDASIARNADVEFLYDRPYEDKRKVRVSGPFTVESLSPHRVLSADEDDPELLEAIAAEAEEAGRPLPERTKSARAPEPAAASTAAEGEDDFVRVVLENLKKAGVQNTRKGERLTFTELKPWAGGRAIHAEGRYREGAKEGEEESGTERRAAVFIGPEYGTVSWAMVRDAAREAVELFDTLIVCGFAFEPQINDAKMQSLGKLTVLKARMNQDLHMAEQLRNTGAGNLFVVFGEPDIKVESDEAAGTVTVEILGLDVFDPTSGEVRASPIEDIACWFVDTDYNGDSFFVRHAYFLGGNDPYQKLKTTLKAEIDEEAWASLYSPQSRPFPKPQSGRIAVKVINHYGDEVMKVYDVG